MKKRIVLLALALLLALLLAGCGKDNSAADASNPNENTQQSQQGQAAPMTSPTDALIAGVPPGYDPASEEDVSGFYTGSGYAMGYGVQYAGATPIPLDPIDMPTATPRPELTFTYGDYTADKLGIKFKSIIGYEVDDSQSDTYILTEPYAQQKDGYSCVITLQISSVTSNYKIDDVKTDLKKYLENLDAAGNYNTWQTYTAASKTLMGGKGWYNNYRAEMSGDMVIRGRVHMALISENKLLTLHITCPGWYNSSFMKVYDQIRDSLKAL